jgi:hypothetical protein
MIRPSLPRLLAAMLAITSPWAAAQKMSPGLWEHTVVMKSQSGRLEQAMKEMQANMASLPPEQRKMMQEMMGRQGVALGANGNSVKVCLSKQDVENDQIPPAQEGCTQTAKRSGNVWQISFQCSGPPPSSGEGQVTLQGNAGYSGRFNVMTEIDDAPERVQMTTTGKWLSADCGKVLPAGR